MDKSNPSKIQDARGADVVEHITAEGFAEVYQHGHHLSPEMVAVLGLAVSEAIKFPCRWKHKGNLICSGMTQVYRVAQRRGFRVKASHADGYVYVLRIA